MRPPSNVLIVMLRRPVLSRPNEMRSDPFWEFGSFDCTGCHRRNLLSPRRAKELEGKRLAFAQGGPNGIRLVHLTPSISVVHHSIGCELRWWPHEMPLKYSAAPTIIDNREVTDTPAILRALGGVRRSTPVAKFASKFRSRREPVELDLAEEFERAYRAHRLLEGAIANPTTRRSPSLRRWLIGGATRPIERLLHSYKLQTNSLACEIDPAVPSGRHRHAVRRIPLFSPRSSGGTNSC